MPSMSPLLLTHSWRPIWHRNQYWDQPASDGRDLSTAYDPQSQIGVGASPLSAIHDGHEPSALDQVKEYPVSKSNDGFLALLHRANQIATEQFVEALGDGDLTTRQVQVLAAIDANEGLSQTGIVVATGIDRSTLADIVRRLSKRKLIERKRSKDDARAYMVKLTEAGRNALANGKPTLASVEKGLLAALPAKQRSELVAMLAIVVASGTAKSDSKSRT
jgi:MarR family transcriptional regulator, temperature-dependent positive regulator of motility